MKSIGSVVYDEYLKVVPRIGYYLKNKNIGDILKYKCPLFAATVGEGRIYLLSNSLEQMSNFWGARGEIHSLCVIANKRLASGSKNKNINIWDIEERRLMSTLSGHTNLVSALCDVGGQLVSGSWDKSLIIWSKLPGLSSIYSHRQILKGHKSSIKGIIRINNTEIISGERNGDLRIWNISQYGVCIRHIPAVGGGWNILYQMKHYEGEIALSYETGIRIWGVANNWRDPLKHLGASVGHSIEFLSHDILLRGGYKGQLEFIYYAQTSPSLLPSIQRLHSDIIINLQRIAKNIVLTSSPDRSLKVIDPISRKCYLNVKENDQWMRAIAYLY